MTVSIPFAIFNSVWRTAGSCLTGLFFTACTSYVVCKYNNKFPWLNHVYTFVITVMIVPILGATAASYELNHNVLQIANKPWVWWITWTSGIGFGFLMQYSAWKNLSWNYAEAAFIDGASNFQVFFKIMLPMIKPILTALFVVNFISGWGEYMTTVMYMDEWPSLGYMIYSLQKRAEYFGMPMYFAVIIVSMIPTIGIFIGFQETIMQNMTTGGLKG
jgi:raffinose/stachyose/melibiose transport system permease protein/N-acetylglucosamine transport system permease protein